MRSGMRDSDMRGSESKDMRRGMRREDSSSVRRIRTSLSEALAMRDVSWSRILATRDVSCPRILAMAASNVRFRAVFSF